MANRIKKQAPAAPSPDKLSPDKQEEVTVKEIVKDERTYKIAGTVSLLLSTFLFLALTSYCFTWHEDQDKLHNFGVKIFSIDDVHVSNLLGVLGAYIAHTFIYKGFGITSFLFCSFFFILGVNFLFGKKIFSLLKNVKIILPALIVVSVTLAFIFRSSEFSFGGAFGELISDWLVKWIGVVGTGALLLVSGFSFFVWKYNPTFTWPERNTAANAAIPDETQADGSIEQNMVDRKSVV